MPWRQVMKERFQFVRDARRRLMSFTELCAVYGISRPVGYPDCTSQPSYCTRASRALFDSAAAEP